MTHRILVLGAGFGGLELTTLLSESLGADAEVTLLDRAESFAFGYSKLDVMFGRAEPADVRAQYRDLVKPGVRFSQETVTAIDAENRVVTTDAGTHEADVLVVALGAGYDYGATPGLREGVNEFYSFAGAEALRDPIVELRSGRVVIGVCGAPYKCPPAPSEAALLLDDQLTRRGVREACEITLATPLPRPVPPSPDTSTALLAAFEERGIRLITDNGVAAVDGGRGIVTLADGEELKCDLFLGVPKHRAPRAVLESGLAEDGYIPVDHATLLTRFADVYAIGDVATQGTPKAGVFAEGAARTVASSVIARVRDAEPVAHAGAGHCYIAFGEGMTGRVDVDFLSGPTPTSAFNPPSAALDAEKSDFGRARLERWFGAAV